MSKEPKRNMYVGHRYVPKIMGEWDKKETYEGLSIVTNEGTSYTSKKRVPVGIDILNEEYWVVTGNYNAQIEDYRKDVRDLQKNVSDDMDELETNLNQNINDFKGSVSSDMNELETNLNQNITDFKGSVSSDIQSFKTELNSKFDSLETKTTNDFEKTKKSIQDISINIKDLGAKNDGSEDVTSILQGALDSIETTGGKILIPTGKYLIKGAIKMVSNLHLQIQQGAELIATDDVWFYYPSKRKGYNGGLENIIIDGGGKIDGLTHRKRINNACHHTRNMFVNNITITSHLKQGHNFDFNGCSNIHLNNIDFTSIEPGGNEQAEIIQLDVSYEGGLSYKTDEDIRNVDNLPSKDITVTNCTFNPLYYSDGSIKSYGAKPFGSHYFSELASYENIIFTDNVINDALDFPGGRYGALIPLQAIKNVQIENNKFYSTNESGNSILSLFEEDSSKLNKNNHSDDIIIKGNVVHGFTKGINALFVIKGNPNHQIKNILIESNKITAEKFINKDVFLIKHFIIGKIYDNYIDKYKKLLNFDKGQLIKINNNICYDTDTLAAGGFVKNIEIESNYFENVSYGVYAKCNIFTYNNNKSINVEKHTLDINESNIISITNNIFSLDNNSSYDRNYFLIYNEKTINKGIITNNIMKNYTTVSNQPENENVIIEKNI